MDKNTLVNILAVGTLLGQICITGGINAQVDFLQSILDIVLSFAIINFVLVLAILLVRWRVWKGFIALNIWALPFSVSILVEVGYLYLLEVLHALGVYTGFLAMAWYGCLTRLGL